MHRLRHVLALAALLSLTAAAASAQEGGRIDGKGSRLLAERAGDRLCLTLVEPRHDLRLRRCLLGAAPDRIRASYVALFDNGRCTLRTRLLGIAPRGTNKVNLSRVGTTGATAKQRSLRIPTRVHRAGGVAFVVRRLLAGAEWTLTAYDAEGRRLAQRRIGPYATPSCVVATPEPVPSDR